MDRGQRSFGTLNSLPHLQVRVNGELGSNIILCVCCIGFPTLSITPIPIYYPATATTPEPTASGIH